MTADDPDPFERLARTVEGTDPPAAAFDDADGGPPPDPDDRSAIWAALQSDRPESGPDREALVRTADFCERCPYLTDPPTLQCTHPGTALVEFPDRDHVRVRGCPFALRNQRPTRERARRPSDD